MKSTTTLVALLTIALLAPSAMAQAPALPVAPSVEVEITGTGPVSLDAAATYSVVVRNTSPGTGTPLDPIQDVVLEVTGIPAGWNAAVSPSSFELQSGQDGTATLTVSVSGDAEATNADITITAFIEQGLQPPLQLEESGSDTVSVERVDSDARTAAETIKDYLPLAIGLSLLLFLLALLFLIMLFRRPIHLSADETSKRIRRGQGVSFPFTVTNRGRESEVLLDVDADLDGWGAFVGVPSVHLAKGASETMDVMITAPQKVPKGTVLHATLTASAGNDKKAATLVFEAKIG